MEKEKAKRKLLFVGKKYNIIADEEDWIIELAPMEYGGPYSMEIDFKDTQIILEDIYIYIGEVYLFAGQSNMELKMKQTNTPEKLYNSNDKLRFFSTDTIRKSDYYTASDGWLVCEKECVENLSALAYLAGNEISEYKEIAVGIIVCYQGESVIESWVPEGTFQKIRISISDEEKFENHSLKWNKDGFLYEYALAQVIPYSISAVVWYQGESDATDAEGYVYVEELCEFIKTWRNAFRDEKISFVIVQLQKAQLEVSSKIQGVKTVISRDVCENDDIHPRTKDKLAKRICEALLS